MTTVYWIFRDFLSPVLSSPPCRPSRALRVGVGWKPPRTTEVLIEFIAMLFMRDRERARGIEKERERASEREREKDGARGEKGREGDMGGWRRKERAVHLDVTYRSGSSTSLEYSRLARECRKANPLAPKTVETCEPKVPRAACKFPGSKFRVFSLATAPGLD